MGELDEHYESYFLANPEKRGEHQKKAKDLAAALPDGWDFLEKELPTGERHIHHLSAKSSQVLSLGLLGSAKHQDPSLEWLFRTLTPTPPPPRNGVGPVSARLEQPVDQTLLNESPRQTAIDFLVRDEAVVVCLEAKWAETGLGACSCKKEGGDPSIAACAQRILHDRPLYWEAAEEALDLPRRVEGRPCPIHAAYQSVRNVAAAKALAADGQAPVFALLYDERNPYFRETGEWPGWPRAIERAMSEREGGVRFASASWQELFRDLPRDPAVDAWALDKHQLST